MKTIQYARGTIFKVNLKELCIVVICRILSVFLVIKTMPGFNFVLQHTFPKAQVNIFVTVLQNDGSGEFNQVSKSQM